MPVNQSEFEKLWKPSVVKIGVSTILITMFMAFLPNLYLYIKYGAFPTFTQAMEAWGLVAAVYVAFYFVEPISYYPILGLTGTYMSFLTGNIGNTRVPSAAVALEVVGEESGTPAAELVSTCAIAGSVVTSLFFVTLGAVCGAALLGVLPESIQIAFKLYTVPAIFGAVMGQFGRRYPVLVIFAFCIPMGLLYGGPVLGIPILAKAYIVIPAAVFGSIMIARVFYVKKLIQ